MSHYFIVRNIIERLGLELLVISQIRIKMPNEDQVHNILMLVGETIFLGGHVIIMNLIIINMLDFYVILGMNFLSRNRVEIDY